MFCPECGTKSQGGQKFCQNCGFSFSKVESPAKDMPPLESFSNSSPVGQSPRYEQSKYINQDSSSYNNQNIRSLPPVTRSYGNWLLLTIVTFGIANLFYQYYVCQDLDRLEYLSDHHYEKNSYLSPKTYVNAGEMLLWLILFSPVYFYKKYNALSIHLEMGHGEHSGIPSGQTYLIVIVVIMFTFWLILPLLIAPFLFLYWEYQFQVALNQHIRNHGFA